MELGPILLSAGFAIALFTLITGGDSRNRRTDKIWIHHRKRRRAHTVGPCAVAAGIYKTYECYQYLNESFIDISFDDSTRSY